MLRIVRVGTHGLKTGSRSTLWGRLSQHRGTSAEADVEARVSHYIGDMPFLWLGVEDEIGTASQRGLIERKRDHASQQLS